MNFLNTQLEFNKVIVTVIHLQMLLELLFVHRIIIVHPKNGDYVILLSNIIINIFAYEFSSIVLFSLANCDPEMNPKVYYYYFIRT